MRLTLLGSGSVAAYGRRAGFGALLEFGSERILINCSAGQIGRMLDIGVRPEQIARMFLMGNIQCDIGASAPDRKGPMKADRLLEIADLMRFLVGRAARLGEDVEGDCVIRGPRDLLAAGSDLMMRLDAQAGARLRLQPEGDSYSVAGADWRVRAVPLGVLPNGEARGHMLRVEQHGRAVVFTRTPLDTVETGALEGLLSGADVIVYCIDAEGNFDGSDAALGHRLVARLAALGQVEQIIVGGLSPALDTPGVLAQICAEMAELFSGEIVIGEDLMMFDLPMPLSTDQAQLEPQDIETMARDARLANVDAPL